MGWKTKIFLLFTVCYVIWIVKYSKAYTILYEELEEVKINNIINEEEI